MSPLAKLVETETDTIPESASVSASLAVLAGIAASDADLKDSAHYGVIHVSSAELKTALRQADSLVALAKGVTTR